MGKPKPENQNRKTEIGKPKLENQIRKPKSENQNWKTEIGKQKSENHLIFFHINKLGTQIVAAGRV